MKIEFLIEKFKLGTITNDEIVFLLEYLKIKEPGHEILCYYQKVWDETEDSADDINSRSLYNRIAGTIGIQNDGLVKQQGRWRGIMYNNYLKPVMRYAAVFFMALGLFWLYQEYFLKQKTFSLITDQIQEVEVPFGSKSRITLPDGSVVILNSGSSLKYSYLDFNSESRSVSLAGEGFFNITKDSTKPFYANTAGMKIKVLGTTFNIKAYPDENTEEATLISGKVEIIAVNDAAVEGKSIILTPNQKAVFVKDKNVLSEENPGIVISEINSTAALKIVSSQPYSEIEQIISWKDDKLIFDNEPFRDLIVRIERWYDVRIIVEYEKLNSARFSGKFDKENIEQVLNALATVTPFKYSVKQNIIIITRD